MASQLDSGRRKVASQWTSRTCLWSLSFHQENNSFPRNLTYGLDGLCHRVIPISRKPEKSSDLHEVQSWLVIEPFLECNSFSSALSNHSYYLWLVLSLGTGGSWGIMCPHRYISRSRTDPSHVDIFPRRDMDVAVSQYVFPER